MFTEKFMDVIGHNGVVAIVSWADGEEAHVVNTWNKYLRAVDGGRLLIPAAGMRHTEKNVVRNPKVKLTLGSPEVQGFKTMGTGFLLEGAARFVTSGAEFDMMKAQYPFLSRVLEVTVNSVKQTI